MCVNHKSTPSWDLTARPRDAPPHSPNTPVSPRFIAPRRALPILTPLIKKDGAPAPRKRNYRRVLSPKVYKSFIGVTRLPVAF